MNLIILTFHVQMMEPMLYIILHNLNICVEGVKEIT